MTEQQHTPGPWRFFPENGDYLVKPENKGATGISVIARAAFHPDRAEQAANARLIASAPDLLAALEPIGAIEKEFSSLLGDDEFVTIKAGTIRRVAEAVRKARGG